MPMGTPRRVNPRACGGDSGTPARPGETSGQSPRVRGRPSWQTVTGDIIGSIPARAGETRDNHGPAPAGRVNPRACGGDPSAQRRLLRVE